ncbi:hypothetical protein SAMD00079811_69110 [Scytonema sp. HK-05]|uniref:hypothetical protein n=1 Tax=Scytonema sp. HK-05 TaxID=1137095 RepID=UPI0009369A5E|nr:hypothetical protein [Scytonema sp. HK-05]OKH58457.1 hypothetical protein NIES2130_14325 [Scytonema sp. HK-05]BAY49282.1 hypothetical protein SAMD00079811_69110 [Scytonema sp. HK-05]
MGNKNRRKVLNRLKSLPNTPVKKHEPYFVELEARINYLKNLSETELSKNFGDADLIPEDISSELKNYQKEAIKDELIDTYTFIKTLERSDSKEIELYKKYLARAYAVFSETFAYLELDLNITPEYVTANLAISYEFHEAFRKNLFFELGALSLRLETQDKLYEPSDLDISDSLFFSKARLLIFKFIGILLLSPENERQFSEEIFNKLRTVGEKLYASEKRKGMEDPLIWLFLPSYGKSMLDKAFNGVGNWKA